MLSTCSRLVLVAVSSILFCSCRSASSAGSPLTPDQSSGKVVEALQTRLASERSNREMEEIAVLAGDWDLVLEAAGAQPAVIARGHATLATILGGQFLEWNTKMTVGDQELHSRGLLGFDSQLRRYEFLWVSELSGAQRLARGRGNPLGQGLGLDYQDTDAVTGAAGRFQSWLQVQDSDHFVLEQREYDGASGVWLVRVRTRYVRRGSAPQ
ncbi:MAG: hypothetical protein ACI9F9_002530 [Candidatus Paceibacteria bacterium]|jgi:hypothetical protein